MTGTPISNILLRLALLTACCSVAPARADDLTLAGGVARLSGTVLSLGKDGVVELSTGLSPEPLSPKAGSVEKIQFSAEGGEDQTPSTMVELTNGDLLPAAIESLDESVLTVVSPVAGRLQIPRNQVASMQAGIRARKVIYQGPRGLEEWTDGSGMKNWAFERDALVCKGPAIASRKLDLPRRFVLRFTLAWQQGAAPSYRIFFADPLVAKGESCNRYYLQFSGAGLEIKRESVKGRHYNTIAVLNRTSEQYPDRRLRVEILVNRDTARLKLLLNGEPEGEFADPIADVPDGSGITLECNPPNNGMQEIRDIEILEYDDSRARHRGEERGDPASDSLISREEDRWSGRLIAIRGTPQGAVFVFKTGFQEQPVEIPETDVSTVFFSGEPAGKKERASAPFVLRLPGGGSLGVSSCQFGGDTASAVHPLLGPLTFRRGGILSITRTPKDAGALPEP